MSLLWWWLHDSMHLSKPIKLDPRKSDFYFVHTEKKKKANFSSWQLDSECKWRGLGVEETFTSKTKKK